MRGTNMYSPHRIVSSTPILHTRNPVWNNEWTWGTPSRNQLTKENDKAWTECTHLQHNTLSGHPQCSQVAPPTVTHITVLTVSGITKWDCQQCRVRQYIYTTQQVLCPERATIQTSMHEHTWCTDLPHNSLSTHWAYTHRAILHQHRNRRKCPPHTLSGSAYDQEHVTFLTVPGTVTFTLHLVNTLRGTWNKPTQLLSQSIMFWIKNITHKANQPSSPCIADTLLSEEGRTGPCGQM